MGVPALLLFGALLAQNPPLAADEAGLERIRKAVAQMPAMIIPSPVPRDGFVFRVTVHAPKPEKPMWDDWSSVPSYIRPNMTSYHYDYLSQVTPEAFRAGTLYPVGMPIGALLERLGKRMAAAHRKTEEESAREEVRQALAELSACRANPAGPGC